MHEMELNQARLGAILWLITWRATAIWFGGLTAGFLVDAPLMHAINGAEAGFIIVFWVAVAYWIAIVMALKKRYRDFRIVLVDPDAGVDASVFS